jgi:hypothetical protein
VQVGMKAVRWLVAVLVTVTSFALATWICGVLVLHSVMKDSATRWGIAGACGAAVAALAALGGYAFASTGNSEESVSEDAGRTVSTPMPSTTSDVHNEIRGGTFQGIVIQGRDISGIPRDATPQQPPYRGTESQ